MASEVLSYNMPYEFNPSELIIDEADDYIARLEWEEYIDGLYEYKMKAIDIWCDCDSCFSSMDISTITSYEEDNEDDDTHIAMITTEKLLATIDDEENDKNSQGYEDEQDRMTPEELEDAIDNYDAYCCALD